MLQGAFGLSTLGYGLVFAVNSLVIGIMSGLNARLVSRIAPERLALIGGGFILVGSAAATLDAAATPRLVVLVSGVTVAAAGERPAPGGHLLLVRGARRVPATPR